ncbi:MAG: hypothetical protein KGL39_34235 [Patescibacteria group bacterium]|nr:hypothetical protein [Patescibacteria group bacterium]
MEPYIYQEYPKCLYGRSGDTLTVASAEEEQEAAKLGWLTAEEYYSGQPKPPAIPSPVGVETTPVEPPAAGPQVVEATPAEPSATPAVTDEAPARPKLRRIPLPVTAE